jgi:peptidoglycan biosynthesis protein MviN/MurJ (putative lipid II flippase)
MNVIFLKTSKLLVFLLVPVGFYLFVFAKPVVELFYQSGNFNEEAVHKSAVFLKLMAVTVFSVGINASVTRVFIAAQAIKQAFFYQLSLNILLIAAIWICTNYYGAYGYPCGVIIMNLVNCIAMYFVCRKLVMYIDYGALLKYTGLIILVNGGIATGLYFMVCYFRMDGILQMTIGFLLYLFVLLILNKKFILNVELLHIFKYAKQKFY